MTKVKDPDPLVPAWWRVLAGIAGAGVAVLLPLYIQCRGDAAEYKRDISSLSNSLKQSDDSLADVKQRLEDIESKSRIVSLYGPDFWAYRSFDLRKEIGASVSIGNCNSEPCYLLTLAGMDLHSTPPEVQFVINGKGFHIHTRTPVAPGWPGMTVGVPLVAGDGTVIKTSSVDFRLVTEDDRANSFRLGIGMREGTGGFSIQPLAKEMSQ